MSRRESERVDTFETNRSRQAARGRRDTDMIQGRALGGRERKVDEKADREGERERGRQQIERCAI